MGFTSSVCLNSRRYIPKGTHCLSSVFRQEQPLFRLLRGRPVRQVQASARP